MIHVSWSTDTFATKGYNIIAKFEATLINLNILEDYSDIEDTEKFDKKWSLEFLTDEDTFVKKNNISR